MNRVIKFRAWDDRNKVMFHFFRMCKPKGSGTLSFECKDYLHEEWDNVDWDSIHVMQFTGLPDKNGKEIYEGDRLKDSSGYIWVVYWYEDHACFGCYDESLPHIKHEIIDNLNFKVIGNIYEPLNYYHNEQPA